MKTFRKISAFILISAMTISLSVPAFAASIDQKDDEIVTPKYVGTQTTTTAQALARTKTRMTTWLNSNFRGRWKEVSGPNVTLASNQWMIVMRIGKQGVRYDYHYWYRTNNGPWANKHGQTPSVLLPASDMPTTNSSSGWALNGTTGFYNSSIVYYVLTQ